MTKVMGMVTDMDTVMMMINDQTHSIKNKKASLYRGAFLFRLIMSFLPTLVKLTYWDHCIH